MERRVKVLKQVDVECRGLETATSKRDQMDRITTSGRETTVMNRGNAPSKPVKIKGLQKELPKKTPVSTKTEDEKRGLPILTTTSKRSQSHGHWMDVALLRKTFSFGPTTLL